MTKEKANPQSPEEMAKAAQEAAVKAAMEQAQSMFGNIPGFQMPGGMEEQLMAQMGAGMPDMAAAQAQQEAMLKAAGIDPETVAQAGRQNMAYAQQMMQGMMDGTLGEELSSSDAMAQMMDAFGSDGWTINKADDGKLDTAQLRLLAFGAPMLVYNDENVDSIDCPEEDVESIRSTIESWWNVTDRESTLEIVKWLLEEGHHAEADEALEKVRKRGNRKHITGRARRRGKQDRRCLPDSGEHGRKRMVSRREDAGQRHRMGSGASGKPRTLGIPLRLCERG